ncbi:unnamed protein product [Phyllotreta striolata]|uniref:CCHC-type domain-containing protein n=1 Tax=Phyllotreta striolata TaxID=444603 RepID=A0A9N9TS66_PHYSR|nr:unnamed protein product [Phyllotreta striolata]
MNLMKSSDKSPESSDISPESSNKSPESSDISPESSNKSPECSDKSPESSNKSPESSDISPESSNKSPESSDKSPESSNKSPESSDISPESSNKSPESSDISPESSNKSPESSNKSPESSDISPESSNKSPESSDKSPESSNKSPESSDISPESSDISPESSNISPESSDKSPESSDKSPESSDKSPESKSSDISPESSNKSPKSSDISPESSNKSPESSDISPESSNKSPESSDKSPESSNKSPESSDKSPESSNKSPESSDISPEYSNKSPESSDKSPESSNKSPESSDISPESSNKLPESSDKSPESSNKSPESSDISPESSNKSPESSDKSPESSNKSPESSDISPESSDISPESSNKSPESSDHQNLVISHQNLVLNHQNLVINHQNLVISSDISPESSNKSPESSDISPESSDISPEFSDISPESSNKSPESSDISPESSDHQELVISHQNLVISHQNLVIYHQNLVVEVNSDNKKLTRSGSWGGTSTKRQREEEQEETDSPPVDRAVKKSGTESIMMKAPLFGGTPKKSKNDAESGKEGWAQLWERIAGLEGAVRDLNNLIAESNNIKGTIKNKAKEVGRCTEWVKRVATKVEEDENKERAESTKTVKGKQVDRGTQVNYDEINIEERKRNMKIIECLNEKEEIEEIIDMEWPEEAYICTEVTYRLPEREEVRNNIVVILEPENMEETKEWKDIHSMVPELPHIVEEGIEDKIEMITRNSIIKYGRGKCIEEKRRVVIVPVKDQCIRGKGVQMTQNVEEIKEVIKDIEKKEIVNVISMARIPTEVIRKSCERDQKIVQILDITADRTKEEIEDAIKEELGDTDFEISSIRTCRDGNQAATVKVNRQVAEDMVRRGRVEIGLIQCRVNEWVPLMRCYRCLQFGHRRDTCKGEDRTNTCFKCSKQGHVAKDCKEEEYCTTCKASGHRANNTTCPKFRGMLRRERRRRLSRMISKDSVRGNNQVGDKSPVTEAAETGYINDNAGL